METTTATSADDQIKSLKAELSAANKALKKSELAAARLRETNRKNRLDIAKQKRTEARFESAIDDVKKRYRLALESAEARFDDRLEERRKQLEEYKSTHQATLVAFLKTIPKPSDRTLESVDAELLRAWQGIDKVMAEDSLIRDMYDKMRLELRALQQVMSARGQKYASADVQLKLIGARNLLRSSL